MYVLIPFDRSAALYEEALRLDPRNVAAHHNLAKDEMRQGELEAAVDGFTRALELNRNDVSVLNNRSICRIRLGDRQRAIADFRSALAIDPGSAEARHNLDAASGVE